MRRSLALSLGLLLLASTLAPASTLAASAWTVSLSGSHVQANIVGDTGGTDATLALYNETSITPFGSATAAAILTALGLGGGYSQEARWPAGNNPAVGCPGGLVDLPFTCRAADRTLLIPGPIQASLTAHAASPGSVSLSVAPDGVSLGYDVSVAAVGIALETLVGGSLIGASATEVGDLAWQLTPDAAGAVAALLRHDDAGALQEILALAKQALQVIIAHGESWIEAVVGHAIALTQALVPGALEVKLAIAVAKADLVFINLAATLLGGNAGTEVALAYAGPAEAGLATSAPLPTAVAPSTVVPSAPPHAATPTRRLSTPSPRATASARPTASLAPNSLRLVSVRMVSSSSAQITLAYAYNGTPAPTQLNGDVYVTCEGAYELDTRFGNNPAAIRRGSGTATVGLLLTPSSVPVTTTTLFCAMYQDGNHPLFYTVTLHHTIAWAASEAVSVPATSEAGLPVTVTPGTTVRVTASGTWCTGGIKPDGSASCGGAGGIRPIGAGETGVQDPSAWIGTLIGRWGDGPWFAIGSDATLTVPSGQQALVLACNDRAGYYADNSGSLTVTVTKVP